MAVIRLFAAARIAAGTGADTVPGSTVGDVLASAVVRYGDDFADVLRSCQIWLNGEPAADEAQVSDDDEIGVLPPVSGGGAGSWDRSAGEQTAAVPREDSQRTPPYGSPGAPAASVPFERQDVGRPDPAPAVSVLDGPRPSRRVRFRSRYAVVYDTAGPRVRLGIGWALLVAGALAYRPARLPALSALYALAAAWAAFQAVNAWRPGRPGWSRWMAAAGAGALPLATAAVGVRGMGVALVALVAGAVGAAAIDGARDRALVASASRTVSCAVWVGVAAASVVLTLRYEIGAVITLLVLVAVYEASDYIVGSGASNAFEGPLAGIISIAVVTAIVAFSRVPPFHGADAFAFGAMAAVGCPIGQLTASAVLPAPGAHAPALRRLDSLLVLAPVWAWAVGLVLARGR